MLIPMPGEFGRHFDTSTGMHCWDGRQVGLDFDVWAYDNGDGTFEVVVNQMLPNEMEAPGQAVMWTARLAEGDEIHFQSGADEPVLGFTAQRVVFESLPQVLQDQIWEAACEGFVFPDGQEHRYDLTEGRWLPV